MHWSCCNLSPSHQFDIYLRLYWCSDTSEIPQFWYWIQHLMKPHSCCISIPAAVPNCWFNSTLAPQWPLFRMPHDSKASLNQININRFSFNSAGLIQCLAFEENCKDARPHHTICLCTGVAVILHQAISLISIWGYTGTQTHLKFPNSDTEFSTWWSPIPVVLAFLQLCQTADLTPLWYHSGHNSGWLMTARPA